jgi:circadian clock protein KaiB
LRVYVAAGAPNSVAAVANLEALLKLHPDVAAEVEIVDVITEPLRGVKDGIVVTPTTVRVSPLPECRLIGSLRDRDALLLALGPWNDVP